MADEDRYKEFDEYLVHGEPGQKERADAWQTAIGLLTRLNGRRNGWWEILSK